MSVPELIAAAAAANVGMSREELAELAKEMIIRLSEVAQK